MPYVYEKAVTDIVAAGRRLDARALAPATSGNYSVRLSDGRIAVTVSGRHKGRLEAADVMLVDTDANPLENKRSSAETLLHTQIYKMFPGANAVLHGHSVAGVALTRFIPANDIVLKGYELLKAFPGIDTHETSITIPVFNNSQDMQILGAYVAARLKKDSAPAYLIRDHGFYAWGRDMEEAERIAEALDHLLACEVETMKLRAGVKS